MKSFLLTISLIITSIICFAQYPSMTIAHTGLAPSDELTVNVGDTIEFIYGSGGSHPMTEGWNSGETSTPVPFETQTVTSANPSKLFTIDTAGVYYFHCGSNPNNSNNWGKITVVGPSSIDEYENQIIKIYPNPVAEILNIEGLSENATIIDASGKTVMSQVDSKTDVSDLPAGIYFVETSTARTRFIKK